MNRLKEIKKWLIEKGLTQAEIAKEAGVSSVTVHNFCKGYATSSNIKSVFLKLGCPENLLENKAA